MHGNTGMIRPIFNDIYLSKYLISNLCNCFLTVLYNTILVKEESWFKQTNKAYDVHNFRFTMYCRRFPLDLTHRSKHKYHHMQ